MKFNIIDESLLIALFFGIWTVAVAWFFHRLGAKMPKIRFVKGEPLPDPEQPAQVQSSAIEWEDPFEEALNGPPKKN